MKIKIVMTLALIQIKKKIVMIIKFHIKEIIKLNFLKRNLDNNDILNLNNKSNNIKISHYDIRRKS
jgi:hypothetical protein